MGFTAIAVGTVAAAGISAAASSSAAGAQTSAENKAISAQQQQYNTTAGNLQPYISGGTNAFSNLLTATGNQPGGTGTGPLTATFQPTMAQLAATPGYQFSLNQGLKTAQNSNASKGLGTSGEALAGANTFAQGLASTTYQQQFQNYLTQNQQIYNMLNGVSNTGLTAASALAGVGTSTANAIGSADAGIGNAQAAGINGIGTAASSAASGLSNSYLQSLLLNKLLNTGTASTAAAGASGYAGANAFGASAASPVVDVGAEW